MKQSQIFTKTRKEAPKDEESLNAKLLIRAGFIHKEMAGVYDFLPLGLRVLNKINTIIRTKMNELGSTEVSLSSLQNPETWQRTDRWSDEKVDIWFKTKLANGSDLGLGFTHEEPLTNLMVGHINSYRDLPKSAYQIQTKFRNEVRAKSGLMRGREFLMKDMYSFSKNDEEHAAFYERAKQKYLELFSEVGLGDHTYLTYASGGSFSKYSHEFQTLTEAGEDIIYICDSCNIAVNKEILAEQEKCPHCSQKIEREEKAVEVGNIFNLGTRFSEALGLSYIDEKGEKQEVVMGSYGIGPGRLMATVVEVMSKSENEMIWPKNIAPMSVHLIEISGKDETIKRAAAEVYDTLSALGIECLWDDREMSAGEKFADADLIGIPIRLILGKKFLETRMFEVVDRSTGEKRDVAVEDIADIKQLI